ncbi:MAG: PQQ-binding-like beta-propeller repeat protein [Planctomycetes bacterium]|nr:PQQ-binding-like beta-propeller repeat protein [Planctomycetota bacterium]
MGCNDASLAVTLSEKGKNLVQSLVLKKDDVSLGMSLVEKAGLAGRVTVRQASYDSLPYADNLANLVVVDNLEAALGAGLSLKEIIRVLAPNGIACLGGRDGESEKTLPDLLRKSGIEGSKIVRENGVWAVFAKPRPETMDEWTHFEHDAGRTSISLDRSVGVPLSLQWLAGGHWPDLEFSGSGAGVGFTSANGRNFYWYNITGRAGISRLICRDAYNGLLLWEKEIERQAHGGALAAVKDRVYVHLGKSGLAALDASSGEAITQFKDAGDDKNAEHLYQDDILIQRAGENVQAFDARSGKCLWKKTNKFLEQDAIVAGEGKLFFLNREGKDSSVSLVCCDLRTGNSIWQKEAAALKVVASLSLLSCNKGMLLLASSPRRYRYGHPEDKWAAVYAVSPEDGRTLWTYEYEATAHFGSAANVFALEKAVWVKRMGDKDKKNPLYYSWASLDPKTGKELNRLPAPYNRCFPDHIVGQYVLTGDMDFFNLENGKFEGTKASRGSCGVGFMPANGLTYSFYLSCNCFNMVRGLMGFSSKSAAVPDGAGIADRLEKGPAYGMAPAEDAQPEDWPTLRHDPIRSGGTTAAAPASLKVLWKADMGCEASSITAAGGKVFVAAIDRHSVVALDSKTGAVKWTYVTNGRVDSPPTFYKGLVLFGSADGWVYCLCASDGRLAWRQPAAPRDQWIVVEEQIESSWPVHGSVLVQDGTVFFAAGRHSFTDGGIFYGEADPFTGKVLWRQNAGRKIQDNVCSVPISDGKLIHIGQRLQFDPRTGSQGKGGTNVLFSIYGILKDNTLPGAASGGMTFEARPWAYGKIVPGGEPRLNTWHAPRKGNILAVRDEATYGVIEEWRTTPAPRHRIWTLFGQPAATGKKWAVEIDYSQTPKALALAGDAIFVALCNKDGKTGEIRAFSASDGRELGRIDLPAAPRWDGMAAVKGYLFAAATNGQVFCMGNK